MGRPGNGESSISRRKDGLYMARYTVQTATGPKRKTIYPKTRPPSDLFNSDGPTNATPRWTKP
jgi:hypothetical protein